MKSNIKNIFFLSAAILSAAVSCTVEDENRQDKTKETSTKLIRRIEVKDDSFRSYDFEYDSYGRLSRVTTSQEGVWTYSYSGNTVFFRSELYAVTEYLDAEGRLASTVAVYNDGQISTTKKTSFIYDESGDPKLPSSLLYSGGNRVREVDFRIYEYGEKSDDFNLDVFNTLISYDYNVEMFIPFYSFQHIHNRNLCKGFTNYEEGFQLEHFSITYKYDDSGNVVQINVGDDQIIWLYY